MTLKYKLPSLKKPVLHMLRDYLAVIAELSGEIRLTVYTLKSPYLPNDVVWTA